MKQYIELSTVIYNTKRFKDYRRMAVFIARSLINHSQMNELITFFQGNMLFSEIVAKQPMIIEQATRQFFYRSSTLAERVTLIQNHFTFLQAKMNQEGLRHIYLTNGIELWREEYKGQQLSLNVNYQGGQKKEGLMAIEFKVDSKRLYQIIFWISNDQNKVPALWLGALQGAPGEQQTIRDLTKYLFGYRPKNLLVLAIRSLAKQLGIDQIYAVSNYGFYANNHFRLDRKLRTSLDEFWQETGGQLIGDKRFFALPVHEPRKDIANVDSHKRNLYRKRFAAIDAITWQIASSLQPYVMNLSFSQSALDSFNKDSSGTLLLQNSY